MPVFQPFRGLRYSPSHIRSLTDVVCPPYDVVTDTDRQELEARSPVNAVRLEVPAFLPGDRGPHTRYERVGQLLDAWRDGGYLHRDAEPGFYGYRMSYTTPDGRPASTVGVVGALGLEPGVLPHEETTPRAKTDRLELLRATRANISPIWGLSPAGGLTGLLGPPAHPAERATDGDGVLHELWPIDDPERIALVSAAVASRPVLVADGHHRFETAMSYRNESSAEDAGAIMALIVELAPEQLTVQAIHRLVSGLPEDFDPAGALAPWFDLAPAGPPDRTILARMEDTGALAVITRTGTWLARPLPATVEAATHDLDASRLDLALADLPPHHLAYQHGWDHCAAAVAAGWADAAILLRPASLSQIAAIAAGGVRMPPKTTFFWPKPRTGMVMRELLA